jgi:hypothetical protein
MRDCHMDQTTTAGAVPATGYGISRFNAMRHGLLSNFTVLPWEDPAEYQTLLASLIAEHDPQGPTEQHLVEELAGVLWRKRRLRLAENATHHRALRAACATNSNTTAAALVLTGAPAPTIDIASALSGTADEMRAELAELREDEALTERALERLGAEAPGAYEAALGILHPSTREAWAEQLAWRPGDYDKGETPYAATAEDLRRYLADAIMPWYAERSAELEAAPKVRLQALGESLDPDKLERLGRYEVHLDRKFERTLSTLLRLQELRRNRGMAE